MLGNFVFGVTILTIVPSITWAARMRFLRSMCGRFAGRTAMSAGEALHYLPNYLAGISMCRRTIAQLSGALGCITVASSNSEEVWRHLKFRISRVSCSISCWRIRHPDASTAHTGSTVPRFYSSDDPPVPSARHPR